MNPRTNGPHRDSGLPGTGINAIALKKIDGGGEVNVTMPSNAKASHVKFSNDGSKIAFLQTKDTGIELWVADAATGSAKAVLSGGDRINATAGDPCDWLKDNATLVCELVPSNRGAAPPEPTVPSGPNVSENYGKAAPAPTYEDLLKTSHDDALFEYYFTSQLAAINTATGAKANIGRPGIFNDITPSPDGQHVLVSRIKKPFSHLVPMNSFAHDMLVLARTGDAEKTIAELPSHEGMSLTGVETGTAQHPMAAGSARDTHLGGGARRRRSEEQGAVPRQGDGARGAVLRPAVGSREDRVALRRHRVHRQRHRRCSPKTIARRARRARGCSSPARSRRRCGSASRTPPTRIRDRR